MNEAMTPRQWASQRRSTLFLTPLVALSILLTSTTGALPSVAATPVTLLCADAKTFVTRVVDASQGCSDSERSLGRSAITEPKQPVSGLHPKLSLRFKVAKAAAAKSGITLYIASGYRSTERQRYLFDKAIKKYGSETEAAKWVLPPYISHHPLGLAIDVNYPADPKGAKWLERNGWRFGLCRIFDNEWWHFEAPIAPGEKCPPRMANASELLGP